jgi:hypothetical protein
LLPDLDADFLPADFFADLRVVLFFAADFFLPPEVLPADLEADFFGAAFFAALLLPPLPAVFDPLDGTFAPLSLASDKPIAIACLRDVTFFPLRPLFSSPFFISCMALFTFLPAPFEYFAMVIVFEMDNELKT